MTPEDALIKELANNKAYDFLNYLEPFQKEWAVKQIIFFQSCHVAVPYRLIQDKAEELKKEDIVNPKEN